jgi:hypothetical protein
VAGDLRTVAPVAHIFRRVFRFFRNDPKAPIL